MEITFRQLQRLTVNELQEYIKYGDAIVTVNTQPKFVVSNYPRFITFEPADWCKQAQQCKEGIRCDLTNSLVGIIHSKKILCP